MTTEVQFEGDGKRLIEQLEGPLRRALEERPAFYSIHIDAVGRVGEVLVRIEGSKGRLPLLFGREELEPGYVFRVVRDTVTRYDF
jgi:hypothetical protein